MRLPRCPSRIHHNHPPRLSPRDCRKSFSHTPKERPWLALKAVLIVPARRAFGISFIPSASAVYAGMRIRIQQDGQFRLQITAQHSMQLEHCFASQLPPATLISLSRVGKTIAQYDASRSQPWFDHFRNMLRPRSKHQRHLCLRIEPRGPRIEQHLANLLSSERSTRLASLDDLVPRLA